MLFFISVRDGDGVGQARWGGRDSLKGTPGPRAAEFPVPTRASHTSLRGTLTSVMACSVFFNVRVVK